ncbi:MAG TPA: hypothetical protein VN285_04370 [Candidatus Deferrimicrobium sp.]|nr:hypothetical protein [Candidatus Deferrimicrobium sp.]
MRKTAIPQQVTRLAVLFVLALAALVAARKLLIPHSFGDYGHYRADVVDEIAAQPINYAGYGICADCHSDIYDLKQQSHHRGLSCESCHGPAAKHVEAPDEFIPGAPRERGYCPLCHGYNLSRPTGFPQILPQTHNPGKPCMSCHNPHNPLLPHPPEECSACHREIATRKTVSHHATLLCTQCHVVPADHLNNPRFVRPQKPEGRAFCGQCHAPDAASPAEIPRIDLTTHHERYLCWDCHYPHSPEAIR